MHSTVLNLKQASLRPTRQRILLGEWLWAGPQPRHVSAEQLQSEVKQSGAHVSLATIYNTLHQFTESGLLREVTVDGKCSYFDTNITPHHHMLNTLTGELMDMHSDSVCVEKPIALPEGLELDAIDVIVRVRPVVQVKAA